MSRPRSFDEDQVLDAAMTTFWFKGYEATSLQDLMAAMNLQKGSIYKAFGDKHQLFTKVLQRYLDTALQKCRSLFQTASSPRAALRFLIEENLANIANENSCGRGCFAVNSAVELAPHDPQVAEMLSTYFTSKERIFTDLIIKGQDKGEFRADLNPHETARFIIMCLHGIGAAVKSHYQRNDARGMANTLLQLLQ